MNFSDIELPSNKKFGLFFAAIFAIAFAYFFNGGTYLLASIFAGLAILFALLAIIKSEVLLPLNKMWMRLGLLLGMIISPIVLGVIFFLMFTPVGLAMRLFGRDELRLKARDCSTYWRNRKPVEPGANSFRHQF